MFSQAKEKGAPERHEVYTSQLPADYHTQNSTEPTYHRPKRSLSLSNFLAIGYIRGAMFPG